MKGLFFVSITILLPTHIFAMRTEPVFDSVQKILIGSPIRQKPNILKEFLASLFLLRIQKKNYSIDYHFFDDNTDQDSKKLLREFAQKVTELKSCCLIEPVENKDEYICNEKTHLWKESIIWKVAAFKDKIIQNAKEKKYDHLFLLDSDLVLHPNTLKHLVKLQKDIVSEVFWTRWIPEGPELPQVWICDFYRLYEPEIKECPTTDFYRQYELDVRQELAPEEKEKRCQQFLDQLRKPGVYEVGGLGGCTLISKKAMEKGVNFKKIRNITPWGEDRHFCIRAAVLEIPLFANTKYPPYHIYQESCLAGVQKFKGDGYQIQS